MRDPGPLMRDTFDVAVIGAGAVGAAIAREAAFRGMSVALIDRSDYGSALSANNLRILHGGVRSLSRLHFRHGRVARGDLVQWRRAAPHLVDELAVVVPFAGRFMPRVGSIVTNLVLGRAFPEAPHRAETLGSREMMELLNGAVGLGVGAPVPRGGLRFLDGLVYSVERLVLALVADAARAGACTANHVEAVGAEVAGDRIIEVKIRDQISGKTGTLRATAFYNATGSSMVDVTRRLGATVPVPDPVLSYSLNVLVPPRPLACALGLGTARRFFFVPWREQLTIGTAHFPVGERPGRAEAVDRFLGDVNRVWPGEPFRPDEVLRVQDGWVPAHSAPGAPIGLVERPTILGPRQTGLRNLLGVATPKYTSALRVGRTALELGARSAGLALPPRDAHKDTGFRQDRTEVTSQCRDAVSPAVLEHTLRAYGPAAAAALDAAVDPSELAPIVEGIPVVAAHFRYGARHEAAVTAEDLVLRRTELGARGLDTPEVRQLADRILAQEGGSAT